MDHMDAKKLVSYLDTRLNATAFEDNAINGVQVANHGQISKIATAVSASLETIEMAAALCAQALIVHHGILKKEDGLLAIVDIQYRKIALLMQHNIALICYHLPLDAHRELGNNWKAARDLGLTDLQPFLELNKQSIGVIGSVSPTSFQDFKANVERYYGRAAQAVRVKNIVTKVAILSGKADRCLKDAAAAGADCFITGTHDEPVWDHAHEEGISFLSLGHYTTEMVGPKALAEHLQTTFAIPCEFIKTQNPF